MTPDCSGRAQKGRVRMPIEGRDSAFPNKLAEEQMSEKQNQTK